MYVDIASVGFTTLILVLCFVLGLVLQFFLEMTAGMGSALLGIAEAIAGGGRSASSRFETPRTNKLAVFGRIVVYLIIIVCGLALAANSLNIYAAVCAIFGGLALGLATVKLFSR